MENLQSMLDDIRIDAQPMVIEEPDADSIVQHSADSALVFLPFRIKANRVVDPFGGSMDEMLFLLPVVALVLAAEDIELDAEPEEGKAAELAAALDTVVDTKKSADKAAKEAAKAEETAEKAKEKLSEITPELSEEEKSRIHKQTRTAQKKAVKADRKAKKAEAKAQLAEEDAKAAGVLPSDENAEDSEDNK
jgi:gamma-glutamylcysteine synthetase